MPETIFEKGVVVMLENLISIQGAVLSAISAGIFLLAFFAGGFSVFWLSERKAPQLEKIQRFRDYFITQQDVDRVLRIKAEEFDKICMHQIRTQQETETTIHTQELLRRYYAAAERIKAYKHNFWWLTEIAKENGFKTWRSYKDYLPPTSSDNPAPDTIDTGFGMPIEEEISDCLGKEFEIWPNPAPTVAREDHHSPAGWGLFLPEFSPCESNGGIWADPTLHS